MFLSEQNMLVSSANIINSSVLEIQCRLLINIIKNKGPKIELWRTPHVISKIPVFVFLLSYSNINCFPIER